MTEWGQAVREWSDHWYANEQDHVKDLGDAAIAELEDRAAYLHGHNVSLMAEVERLRLQYRPDAVDKCIDELKAEVERLRAERGCEDGECRLALLSEVERLTWMLEEFIAPEIRDEVIADLARRWEERNV